jgi:hypothetical protein
MKSVLLELAEKTSAAARFRVSGFPGFRVALVSTRRKSPGLVDGRRWHSNHDGRDGEGWRMVRLKGVFGEEGKHLPSSLPPIEQQTNTKGKPIH